MLLKVLRNVTCRMANWAPLTDDYEITGLLGQGSTSRVFKGFHVITDQSVTLKMFKLNVPSQKIDKQIAINLKIRDFKDLNLYPITLEDSVIEPVSGAKVIVFKYQHGVPLALVNPTKIIFKEKIKLTRQLLDWTHLIHSRGIIHRDIKASNVLYSSGKATLFDYGLAYMDIPSIKTNRFGTKGYYSPEVVFRMPNYTNKVDVWTMAVVIIQLLGNYRSLMPYTSDGEVITQLCRTCGFDQADKQAVISQLHPYVEMCPKNDQVWKRRIKREGFPIEATELLQSMLEIDPNRRVSSDRITQSRFYRWLVTEEAQQNSAYQNGTH